MLDLMKRGTVTVSSVTWEYHGDTANAAGFYITPQPSWVTGNGLPDIQIVEYQTSDPSNGSGYCVLQVELTLPDQVVQAVTADIATRFGVSKPQFLTLPVQSGTVVNLSLPDGQGGVTGLQASGTDFGSDNAIFQVPLTAAQMSTVKSTIAQKGNGPFEIVYNIIVPAQMPAVTAQLSFDATTAFNYEVTAHEHTHWASDSSWTYDISEQLTQSQAAKVVVDKVDPNLPQAVVDAVSNWGTTVIKDMVAKEVAAALALQQDAGGTQPFSINEVSSFSEAYEQDETILWRLNPQSSLPTFGDLGLTRSQVDSLEVTVDKRQFVAQVTPQCMFKTSSLKAALGVGLLPGDDPFMSNIKPLQRLEVTITYPTLMDSSTRTHTFTDNTPYTWQADWDDKAQGQYSLSYLAVYDDNTKVTGSVDDVDATTYTLGLADIGTLNVCFNATQFFTGGQGKVVDHITVDFSFNIPQEPPFLQSAVLTSQAPTTVFSTVFPGPLTTNYVYTVTYAFVAGVKANPYTSDAKSQNGQWVRLLGPDATQSFNVIVAIKLGDAEVTEADINFYYENDPYFPDIPGSSVLPRPTQSSPIQLTFPTKKPRERRPADPPPKPTIEIQKIELFSNTVVTPVTVNATLLLSDFTQLQSGPYQFAPSTLTLFAFSPATQTIFLTADPAIVQWKPDKEDLTSVKVLITAVRYTEGTDKKTVQVKSPNQVITQQPDGQAYPVFFVLSGMPYDFSGLEFDWTATYVYKSGAKYTKGTQEGTILSLPTVATAAKPPGKIFA